VCACDACACVRECDMLTLTRRAWRRRAMARAAGATLQWREVSEQLRANNMIVGLNARVVAGVNKNEGYRGTKVEQSLQLQVLSRTVRVQASRAAP
jgi:hypothetical protein